MRVLCVVLVKIFSLYLRNVFTRSKITKELAIREISSLDIVYGNRGILTSLNLGALSLGYIYRNTFNN